MEKLIVIAIITLFPFIELRGSIPYGVLANGDIDLFGVITIPSGPQLDPLLVFAVAVLANLAIIPVVMKFLDWFFHILENIKIGGFEIGQYFVRRTHRRAKPFVDKYGTVGLMLFVAIPLPVTGAYTGALAAHILGMNNKKAMMAIGGGVIIAGILVTLLVTVLQGLAKYFFLG
ncbi:MAG: hypothetical protein A7315_03760 [Candidatus Altiarchaeales archaeon WOR_SM1_79]|nr:MAG: hypothetical protein A7315_03760 [Candidatus Altiarchaeales archaeon WOR_SM1_79]